MRRTGAQDGAHPHAEACNRFVGAASHRLRGRSSKPVRRRSPTLGRFDSCAAPLVVTRIVARNLAPCVITAGFAVHPLRTAGVRPRWATTGARLARSELPIGATPTPRPPKSLEHDYRRRSQKERRRRKPYEHQSDDCAVRETEQHHDRDRQETARSPNTKRQGKHNSDDDEECEELPEREITEDQGETRTKQSSDPAPAFYGQLPGHRWLSTAASVCFTKNGHWRNHWRAPADLLRSTPRKSPSDWPARPITGPRFLGRRQPSKLRGMGRVELKDGPSGPWTCSVTVWRIFPARLSRCILVWSCLRFSLNRRVEDESAAR
jgi:hypothetical protein